jgi:hypothetical protein
MPANATPERIFHLSLHRRVCEQKLKIMKHPNNSLKTIRQKKAQQCCVICFWAKKQEEKTIAICLHACTDWCCCCFLRSFLPLFYTHRGPDPHERTHIGTHGQRSRGPTPHGRGRRLVQDLAQARLRWRGRRWRRFAAGGTAHGLGWIFFSAPLTFSVCLRHSLSLSLSFFCLRSTIGCLSDCKPNSCNVQLHTTKCKWSTGVDARKTGTAVRAVMTDTSSSWSIYRSTCINVRKESTNRSTFRL